MTSALWGFINRRKKEFDEAGKKYTQDTLCEELGVSRAYLHKIMNGKGVISYKMADNIERATNGELKADEILEESIAWHRRWLARQKKYGMSMKSAL